MHAVSKKRFPYRGILITAIVFMGVIAALVWVLYGISRTSRAQQADVLKRAITRAAITCYAIEGRYPQNLQYMIDHYGVIVDTDTYVVSYQAFAQNLMPDIHVMIKGGSY